MCLPVVSCPFLDLTVVAESLSVNHGLPKLSKAWRCCHDPSYCQPSTLSTSVGGELNILQLPCLGAGGTRRVKAGAVDCSGNLADTEELS